MPANEVTNWPLGHFGYIAFEFFPHEGILTVFSIASIKSETSLVPDRGRVRIQGPTHELCNCKQCFDTWPKKR